MFYFLIKMMRQVFFNQSSMFLFYLKIANKMRQVSITTISELSDICDGSSGRLYMQAHGKGV